MGALIPSSYWEPFWELSSLRNFFGTNNYWDHYPIEKPNYCDHLLPNNYKGTSSPFYYDVFSQVESRYIYKKIKDTYTGFITDLYQPFNIRSKTWSLQLQSSLQSSQHPRFLPLQYVASLANHADVMVSMLLRSSLCHLLTLDFLALPLPEPEPICGKPGQPCGRDGMYLLLRKLLIIPWSLCQHLLTLHSPSSSWTRANLWEARPTMWSWCYPRASTRANLRQTRSAMWKAIHRISTSTPTHDPRFLGLAHLILKPNLLQSPLLYIVAARPFRAAFSISFHKNYYPLCTYFDGSLKTISGFFIS